MNKEYILNISEKIKEDELTNKEFAKVAKVSEERLEEILRGNEPTVEEFINIGIALGKNLSVLGSYFIEDQRFSLYTLYDLKKSIEKKDDKTIAYLLVTNGIVVKDKEVYLVNVFSRINKKLDDEVLYSMYDLLLKSNRYDLLKRMPRVFEILKIDSLSSLEKYPVDCVYNFIYGTKNLKNKSIDTMMFINKDIQEMLSRLDLESQKIVIHNLIRLYKNYLEAIKDSVEKDGYLSTYGSHAFIHNGDKYSAEIVFLDLGELEGYELELNQINEITKELKKLINHAIDLFDTGKLSEMEKHNMFIDNMNEEVK